MWSFRNEPKDFLFILYCTYATIQLHYITLWRDGENAVKKTRILTTKYNIVIFLFRQKKYLKVQISFFLLVSKDPIGTSAKQE